MYKNLTQSYFLFSRNILLLVIPRENCIVRNSVKYHYLLIITGHYIQDSGTDNSLVNAALAITVTPLIG